MRVADLLRAALALLDEPEADTAAIWPRGAAVLAREAIEKTLDVFWTATAPAMHDASRTEQWIALPAYLGRTEKVPAAFHAWSELSTACHQRAYDVGLTESELRGHLRAANDLAVLVGQRLQVARAA